MYLFKAYYENMDNGDEIIRKIEFDDHYSENEKECYVYAMIRACELKKRNECLGMVEFIYS